MVNCEIEFDFSWWRNYLTFELQWLKLIQQKQHEQLFFFFSIWVFFHYHSRITGLQGKGEGNSLTPHYHFHPLHRHLDISRAIAAESSPLHVASRRTQTGNLWFPTIISNRASFQINNNNICVPVVTLSINDNIKFTEHLKQGFKRGIP